MFCPIHIVLMTWQAYFDNGDVRLFDVDITYIDHNHICVISSSSAFLYYVIRRAFDYSPFGFILFPGVFPVVWACESGSSGNKTSGSRSSPNLDTSERAARRSIASFVFEQLIQRGIASLRSSIVRMNSFLHLVQRDAFPTINVRSA